MQNKTTFITNQFNAYFEVQTLICEDKLTQCKVHESESAMQSYLKSSINFSRCSVVFINIIIKSNPADANDIYWVDGRGYQHTIALENETLEQWISQHEPV